MSAIGIYVNSCGWFVFQDLGCGIGGPARAIAAFSQADIKGINNNDYQIRRAQYLTDKAKLSHLISFEKVTLLGLDYMNEK